MHFDTNTFVTLALPQMAGVLALVFLAIKAFRAPSKEQHEQLGQLLDRSLGVLEGLASAAAQSVKPKDPKGPQP